MVERFNNANSWYVPEKSCIFGAGIHTMTVTPVEKKWWVSSGNDLYWLMPPQPEVARFHKG